MKKEHKKEKQTPTKEQKTDKKTEEEKNRINKRLVAKCRSKFFHNYLDEVNLILQ